MKSVRLRTSDGFHPEKCHNTSEKYRIRRHTMLNIFMFLLELVRVVIILFAGLALLFFVESKLFMIALEGAPFFLLLFANMILFLVF